MSDNEIFIKQEEPEDGIFVSQVTDDRPAAAEVLDLEETDSMEISEDGDPVVSTVPVYLSQSLRKKLVLVQYPTLPKNRSGPINSYGERTGRSKVEAKILEIDLPLDTNRFFDLDKAKEWGDIQSMTLKGDIKECDEFTVGLMNEGGLYLSPVPRLCQMRPNLAYVDTNDKINQEAQRITRMDPSKPKEVRSLEMHAKSANDLGARFSDAILANKLQEEDSYVEMAYLPSDSEVTNELIGQIKSAKKDLLVSKTTFDEYIDKASEAVLNLPMRPL